MVAAYNAFQLGVVKKVSAALWKPSVRGFMVMRVNDAK